MSEWAEKYDVLPDTARQWIKKNFLEAKKLDRQRYQVLDLQPDKHPGWDRYLQAAGIPGHKGKSKRGPTIESPDDPLNEKRKERLREVYLPRLLALFNKYPDRLSFTAREIKDNLGELREDGSYMSVNNELLYKIWPSWGLRVMVLPNDNPSQQNFDKKVGYAIDNKTKGAYLRDVLYNFFSGHWGAKGHFDVDDKLKRNIIGAPTSEDGFYHYDRTRVFPLDSRGFFAWMDEVKPVTRSKEKGTTVPIKLLPWQKKFVTEMLKMGPDGRYIYNVGFASAQRGEGKSYILKLVAIFLFFNGYAQDIKIAGNSKDEAASVHYDEMRDLINDTPKLANFPGLDVKGKHIVIMKGAKDILNKIECVPKASGLHPNMTLGLITELHNYTAEDRKFYTNFVSSRRGTPNAMVLVDSTVEDEGTIIHGEWKKYTAGKLKKTYFFHKDSDDGFENPETTEEFLADEAERMTEDEYRKAYGNKWGDAATTFFGAKAIRKMGIAATSDIYGATKELAHEVDTMHDLDLKLTKFVDAKVSERSISGIRSQIDEIDLRLTHMDDLYTMPAKWTDLEKLMKLFGIRAWVIGASLDRSSLGQDSDRTALVCVARGLVDEFTSYYFLLDIFMPFVAEAGMLEKRLEDWREAYYDVDKIIITEHQGLDLFLWCGKNSFEADYIHTTYKYQKPRFADMYRVINKGYFKAPTVPYYTDEKGQLYEGYTNKADIFQEELRVFRHISKGDSGKFGPPDKRKKGGIKDDVVDAVCGAIYACNGEGMDEIARSVGQKGTFGIEIHGSAELVGSYREG